MTSIAKRAGDLFSRKASPGQATRFTFGMSSLWHNWALLNAPGPRFAQGFARTSDPLFLIEDKQNRLC